MSWEEEDEGVVWYGWRARRDSEGVRVVIRRWCRIRRGRRRWRICVGRGAVGLMEEKKRRIGVVITRKDRTKKE